MCVKRAKGRGLQTAVFRVCGSANATPAHLRGAAVAEGLLREAAAALDVLLPLEERRELSLQDLRSGGWKEERDRDGERGEEGQR